MMAQLQVHQGRFDCEFVVKPPKALQSECPVCLQVLREPYQTTCCGKSYCRRCINRLKAGRNKCACCNKQIQDFPNIGLQQSLYDFKVYCGNKSQGCQWVGELRQLDDHLNNNPPKEKYFEGCQFTCVQCLYCQSEQGHRSVIQSHQKNDCPMRPFKCIHCNRYESTYQDVATNHWPICQHRPEPCPNRCGMSFYRRNGDLDSHVVNDCPLTIIECEYKRVGCDIEVLRKDMDTHLDKYIAHHLSLQATKQRRLAKSIKVGDQKSYHMKLLTEGTKLLCENTASHMLLTTDALVEYRNNKKKQDVNWVMGAAFVVLVIIVVIANEKNQMDKRIAELAQNVEVLQSHASICPLYINFTNFGQYRQMNDTWYSPPFYTHPKGYKMCLKVYVNGRKSSSKGMGNNHVAVFLLLMRGRFDTELEWPFRGKITVQLLNRINDGKHENVEKTYTFDNTISNRIANRVQKRERAKNGLGYNYFISHADLWPKYLRKNYLRFFIECST